MLACTNSKLLIINSYFPVDKRTQNDRDVGELLETLEAIKHTIENNEFNDVLFLGDINADFLRNSTHSNRVQTFLEDFHFLRSWDRFEVDFTMCHDLNEQSYVSTLDHFFWNEDLDNKIVDAGVIHSPDNFSDHSPIYCIIHDDIPSSNHNFAGGPPKPKWKKASADEKESFKLNLDEQLERLNIPESVLNCRNVHCKDDSHCGDADSFMTSVLDTIDVTAHNCLPMSNPRNENRRQKTIIPGWSQFVKPYRDRAFFWSQVWKSAGRPLNCQLHIIMKKTFITTMLRK